MTDAKKKAKTQTWLACTFWKKIINLEHFNTLLCELSVLLVKNDVRQAQNLN